jgi:hypothetical protein
MYSLGQLLYPFVAFVAIIIIIVMSSLSSRLYYPFSSDDLVEPIGEKCTPCDQEEDTNETNGANGNRRNGRNRRNRNGKEDGTEEEEVYEEDTMTPDNPNFANIQTIRQQRMVQRQSTLGSLKQEFESLFLTPATSFCEHNKGNSPALQKQCSALTFDNCNSTSCCVWAGKSSRMGRCAPGDATGLTYKTAPDGRPINVDTYYYQNKCNGPQCPLAKMVKMSRMKNEQ